MFFFTNLIIMSELKILTIPDSRLKEKASQVKNFDQNLRSDIKDMYDTLYASENGIGLAATQVGIMKRLIVIDLKEDDASNPRTLVNPKIIETSKVTSLNQEGCLSIPGYYADIERFESVKYEWFTEFGEKKQGEAEGLLSICIQHEIDHLNGILFIDYLSSLKRKMASQKVKKHLKSK